MEPRLCSAKLLLNLFWINLTVRHLNRFCSPKKITDITAITALVGIEVKHEYPGLCPLLEQNS